jgi:cytidylate kinase
MRHIEGIDLFIRAQIAAEEAQQTTEPRPHPFITISREAGAGGHSLADALLEAFSGEADRDLFGGWKVFDQRLCEIVAEDPRYASSLDSMQEEEYRSRTDEFFRQLLGSQLHQDVVMNRVFRVVRALATLGKAIIVGRGGSQVTKGMPYGVALRLVAPEDHRIDRLMELHDLSERDARDLMRKRDSHRARLLKTNFSVDVADPTNYDATWNTATVPYDEIAASIVALIQQRVAADRDAV